MLAAFAGDQSKGAAYNGASIPGERRMWDGRFVGRTIGQGADGILSVRDYCASDRGAAQLAGVNDAGLTGYSIGASDRCGR